MRKKVIAGNWKMNMDLGSGTELVRTLREQLLPLKKSKVIFCPPFPLLAPIYELIKDTQFGLGGQNLHWEEKGAFTGEVSAAMLKSVGCQYVIIGHSERRKYFHETDEVVNKKLKRALLSGLKQIVCVGETLEERESNRTREVVKTQLEGGFKDLKKEDLAQVIIAYEPVWAIGTGRTATPEQAVEVHQFIRELLSQWYDADLAARTIIQYGGSVNDKNAESLLSQEDIDGALVGGASLKAESFAAIANVGEQYS